MDLTRVFPAETYASALESWTWIDIGDRRPVFTSLFGDVFFLAADGIWMLDTLEGRLSRPWDDAEAGVGGGGDQGRRVAVRGSGRAGIVGPPVERGERGRRVEVVAQPLPQPRDDRLGRRARVLRGGLPPASEPRLSGGQQVVGP